MSLEKYQEMIRSLPMPTVEQTERFAEHVAEAHSWYKTLALYPPGNRFIFFLKPHAGRVIRRDPDTRELGIHDITEASECGHYSSCLTSEYRERYGHWSYRVDQDPRMPKGQSETPDSDDCFGFPPASTVFDAAFQNRISLPVEVRESCSCQVTAFVRPSPAAFHMLLMILSEREELQRFGSYAQEHLHDPDVARCCSLFESFRRASVAHNISMVVSLLEQEEAHQRQRLSEGLLKAREFFAAFMGVAA